MKERDQDDATQKMDTLSECLNKSIERGYTENFTVDGKRLASEDGKSHYAAKDVAIPNFYRFEGYSSPEDNSILYLVETTDGKMGTLIDSYGSDADATISAFIREVQDIQKQNAED